MDARRTSPPGPAHQPIGQAQLHFGREGSIIAIALHDDEFQFSGACQIVAQVATSTATTMVVIAYTASQQAVFHGRARSAHILRAGSSQGDVTPQGALVRVEHGIAGAVRRRANYPEVHVLHIGRQRSIGQGGEAAAQLDEGVGGCTCTRTLVCVLVLIFIVLSPNVLHATSHQRTQRRPSNHLAIGVRRPVALAAADAHPQIQIVEWSSIIGISKAGLERPDMGRQVGHGHDAALGVPEGQPGVGPGSAKVWWFQQVVRVLPVDLAGRK